MQHKYNHKHKKLNALSSDNSCNVSIYKHSTYAYVAVMVSETLLA